MTTTDHESKIRGLANNLHDAIRAAEGAGFRVTYPGSVHDLPAIAISETGRVNPVPGPGDDYELMSKAALVDLATAKGLPTTGNKADLIATLRAPPAPATPVPKGTTTLVP